MPSSNVSPVISRITITKNELGIKMSRLCLHYPLIHDYSKITVYDVISVFQLLVYDANKLKVASCQESNLKNKTKQQLFSIFKWEP